MNYVKHFNINGVDTKQVACIEVHGKPNAATQGYVGVLAIDMDSPTHDVYKCTAVNGSIYTWELLSSGMSIICARVTGNGEPSVEFSYDKLMTPATYTVKIGDLILDNKGYLYQVSALNSTYCTASYCDIQLAGGGISTDVDDRLKELEKWMADENYTAITASLSVSPSTKEYGGSVTGAKLTWSVSKATKSITLTLPNGEVIDLSDKTSPYTDTNTYKITAKKTWTLNAVEADRSATVSKTASVNYYYYAYWGVGTETKVFDEDFIKDLSNFGNVTSKSKTITVSPNNQYVYYAVPKALCSVEPTFQIGEFPATGGFEPKVEVTLVNAYGESIVYYLYRTTELLTLTDGETSINIYVK